MGSEFAGVLGPLAFVTVVLRNVLSGANVTSTMKLALIALFAFAAIGYVLGRIAEMTVTESVKTKMNAELALLDEDNRAAEPTTNNS